MSDVGFDHGIKIGIIILNNIAISVQYVNKPKYSYKPEYLKQE